MARGSAGLTQVAFDPDAWAREHEARKAYKPSVGDVVVVQDDYASSTMRGVLWTVKTIRTVEKGRNAGAVEYVLDRVGGGKGLRIDAYGLRAATDAEKAKVAVTPTAVTLHAGQVFRVGAADALRLRGVSEGDVYVVLARNADGTVKGAALNGAEGRFYPKMPVLSATVVTATVE